MYGFPYSIRYNEETGRLEPLQAAYLRRIRHAERLRKRYRAVVIRRTVVGAFRALWRLARVAFARVKAEPAAGAAVPSAR